MDSLEFRRQTLIDPGQESPARTAHMERNPSSKKFAEQILWQDELMREATEVEAPDGFAARILLNQSLQSQSRRPTRTVWLSLAASFFLAIALIPAMISTDDPGEELLANHGISPLDVKLVSHMSKHDILNAAYLPADQSAPLDKIRHALHAAATEMPADLDNILYASTCVVDGKLMAHLMVRHGDQHYVVYLIPQQELADKAYTLEGWNGQQVAMSDRTMVIFNRSGSELEQASKKLADQFNQPLGTGRTI